MRGARSGGWVVFVAPSAWMGAISMLAASCGGDGESTDPGDAGADAAATCTAASDCDDGLYCNGAELCMPGAPGAGPDGCVAGSAPCLESQTCDEPGRRCVTDCGAVTDADGDGHDAIDCGGDDCEDADANRFPGNTEVCDAEGRDEDCDPSTLGGDGDADGDGFVSDECCNEQPDATLLCGGDCDDTAMGINPGSPEACNMLDDDCDGLVDEAGSPADYYPDCDGDGYGDETAEPTNSCGPPADPPASCPDADLAGWSTTATDCNDAHADVHPDQTEFFVEPICPPGTRACPCTSLGNTRYGCVDESIECVAPDYDPNSRWCNSYERDYDFDCDGLETRPPGKECGEWPECFGASGEGYHEPERYECGNEVPWGYCSNDAVEEDCLFGDETMAMGCR